MFHNLSPDLAEACKTRREIALCAQIRQEMFSGVCQQPSTRQRGHHRMIRQCLGIISKTPALESEFRMGIYRLVNSNM